jgi:hypothetical protein
MSYLGSNIDFFGRCILFCSGESDPLGKGLEGSWNLMEYVPSGEIAKVLSSSDANTTGEKTVLVFSFETIIFSQIFPVFVSSKKSFPEVLTNWYRPSPSAPKAMAGKSNNANKIRIPNSTPL